MKTGLVRATIWLVASGLLAYSSLYANIAAPGDTLSTIPTLTVLPGGAPIDFDPYSGAAGGLRNVGSWKKVSAPNAGGGITTFVSAAYYDSVTNGLDFFYQVQNTYTKATTPSNTLNQSFHLLDFTGFATDVFQLQGTGTGSWFGAPGAMFLGPTSNTVQKVVRSSDGSVLTVTLASSLLPKLNSSVFEIKTDAQSFDDAGVGEFSWNAAPPAGSSGVSSTLAFDLSGLEPIATPEPAFYGVLFLSLAGLVFFSRRRRAAQ